MAYNHWLNEPRRVCSYPVCISVDQISPKAKVSVAQNCRAGAEERYEGRKAKSSFPGECYFLPDSGRL